MSKKSSITELSEILATSLAGRPDLNKRLQSLLGSGHKSGDPVEEPELTHKQRKEKVRNMFSALWLKGQLKKRMQ